MSRMLSVTHFMTHANIFTNQLARNQHRRVRTFLHVAEKYKPPIRCRCLSYLAKFLFYTLMDRFLSIRQPNFSSMLPDFSSPLADFPPTLNISLENCAAHFSSIRRTLLSYDGGLFFYAAHFYHIYTRRIFYAISGPPFEYWGGGLDFFGNTCKYFCRKNEINII